MGRITTRGRGLHSDGRGLFFVFDGNSLYLVDCSARHSRVLLAGLSTAAGLVIQRLCFGSLAFKEQSFHSSCGRAGYFSSAAKKSNQKTPPQNIAPYGHPAHRVRDNGRVPLIAHPCAIAECARSSRAPYGPDRPLSPQCNGDPEKPEQRASCAPKLEQEAGAPLSALPLLLLVISGPRQPRRGHDGFARRVARRMRASSRMDRDVHRANPGMTSRTAVGGAAPGAAFLWLLSCRCRQESDPLVRRTSGSLCS